MLVLGLARIDWAWSMVLLILGAVASVSQGSMDARHAAERGCEQRKIESDERGCTWLALPPPSHGLHPFRVDRVVTDVDWEWRLWATS